MRWCFLNITIYSFKQIKPQGDKYGLVEELWIIVDFLSKMDYLVRYWFIKLFKQDLNDILPIIIWGVLD